MSFPLREPDRSKLSAIPFHPATLFANGEDGAFFDAVVASSIYPDECFNFPSQYGDTVGGLIDQSQSMKLGPDEFHGFDVFDTGAWTDNGDGSYTSIANSYQNLKIYGQNFADNQRIGDLFQCQVNVDEYVSGAGYEWVDCFYTISDNFVSELGLNTRLRMIKDAGGYLWFRERITAGTVSGFSLKKVLGNHSHQTDAALRPTYQTMLGDIDAGPHVQFDGVDDVLPVTLRGTSSDGTAYTTETAYTVALHHPLDGWSFTEGLTLAQAQVISSDFSQALIINRPLTDGEKTALEVRYPTPFS
ncbi:hypothetical protein [Tropicimonas isoalkanivorans]|nr:hypothetical protein [Tropicimonas isoalkanivorans]